MSIRLPHPSEGPSDLDPRREPAGTDERPADQPGGQGRPAPGPAAFRTALAGLGARLAGTWPGPRPVRTT